MFTVVFWKGTAERAAKSAAQALILFWGLGDGLLSLWSVSPVDSLGIAAGAVVLSLLTSILSIGAGPVGSPSLVREQPVAGGSAPPAAA